MPPRTKTAVKTPVKKTASVAKSPQGQAGENRTAPVKRRSIPWDEIRREFVEGWDVNGDIHLPNLRELSERHDVGYVRVRERSAKERWKDRRDAMQIKVTQERQKKRALGLAKNAIEFDEKAHNVAKLGIAMVTVRLAEISQEVGRQQEVRARALVKQQQGLPVDKHELWSAVNYRELEGLASAAERFQTIGQKALGTDVQKHEITGADGGPIESTVGIVVELNRDDPERLAMMIKAMHEANLVSEDDWDIVEGTVVEQQQIEPPQEGTAS